MNKIVILFFAIFIGLALNAQNDCKVLVEKLKGEYIGECKKGKAHGQGSATGEESYTGRWKKGYPNGEGIYTYANGDVYKGIMRKGKKDGKGILKNKLFAGAEVKIGYWENDKYIGENKLTAKYYITKNSGLDRVRISKRREGENSIRLIFTKTSQTLRSLPDGLMKIYSSGIESSSSYGAILILDDVEFPFHMELRFTGSSKLAGIPTKCELNFEINMPGEWEVHIGV